MQLDPKYEDVVNDILRYLKDRLEAAVAHGIAWENLAVDPGVGFGKTHQHNIELVARLEEFQALGRPLCLGVSRKGFIGKITGKTLDQRLAGSLAVATYALARNAVQILRVHDVAQTRDAVLMCAALRKANCRCTRMNPDEETTDKGQVTEQDVHPPRSTL